MTMGLVVIMIVLIGVMGAGLLVFVRSDLEAVVEVNQGQRAFETADAGVQLAKRRLLSDATRTAYDNDAANGDSPWSARSGGKDLTFDGKTVNVKIQYLSPSTTPTQLTDPNNAPELVPPGQTDYPPPRNYFKVVSEGTTGKARRKIEAIFNTYDMGVPRSYFTPNNIKLTGTSDVTDVSLFALGDVTLTGGAEVEGIDLAYGDWNRPPFNIKSRPTTNAGIGAVGNINSEVAGEDYDGVDGPNPRFVKDPSSPQNGATEITFPFDYKTQIGTQDQERMDFLREEAKLNGVYRTSSGGVVDVGTDFAWPANATERTIVFVEFTNAGGTNRVDWSVGSESDAPVKGTLVINGGDFKMTQHKACLEGIVIVRGGIYEDGDSVDAGGNTCLDGFVNASGDIEIKGNVDPLASAAVISRPGFYGVRLWSWRELYQ